MADGVRHWNVRYLAHNRKGRPAIVLVPSEYGPNRPTPRLPLVICPHGRGVKPEGAASLWGNLPALGGFAVICPGGRGRRTDLTSWGYPPQIADLAKMPDIANRTLNWLRIDDRKVYALGGSMGGQESLLLLGQFPKLLRGVAAFDSVTNFYRRYFDFAKTPRRKGLQAIAAFEVGGTPRTNPVGYVRRSPSHWTRDIAKSGVPLQMWWSLADQIVIDQARQSAHFFAALKKLKPKGRLDAVTGFWLHSVQMRQQIPDALRFLGLLDE